jgi:hypothetical protein
MAMPVTRRLASEATYGEDAPFEIRMRLINTSIHYGNFDSTAPVAFTPYLRHTDMWH